MEGSHLRAKNTTETNPPPLNVIRDEGALSPDCCPYKGLVNGGCSVYRLLLHLVFRQYSVHGTACVPTLLEVRRAPVVKTFFVQLPAPFWKSLSLLPQASDQFAHTTCCSASIVVPACVFTSRTVHLWCSLNEMQEAHGRIGINE